jgi:hypothetical protein
MGRVEIERAVADARMYPGGPPRFYPPGKHPATARLREHLARLREFDARCLPGLFGKPSPTEQAIEYCEERLAIFDVGEARALQAFVECLGHRSTEG